MGRKWTVLLVAVVGLLAVIPSYAHHGTAAYDAAKDVTITGTVTAFNFLNPHVLIAVDVKSATGTIEKWQGEMTSPNHLTRMGWNKNTLKPGDQVTLVGSGAKSGAPTLVIHKVLKNGQEIQLGTE
jgi:hypothetical protein